MSRLPKTPAVRLFYAFVFGTAMFVVNLAMMNACNSKAFVLSAGFGLFLGAIVHLNIR